MSAISFRVTGRVQGVGFRAYVVRIGESLGLSGEVWNTRDGAVEGYAVGDQTERFVQLLQRGPGYVASVTTLPSDQGATGGFGIGPTR